ncbi:MAG: hypothetical protein F4Z48_01630, partial [Dehalococcoidia bacterium]|nr:hypothetical protein [Dehalococcoidia bacterium]
MNDARHARPFLEAFDRAIADLYAQHDGLRVNVLYTYEMPDLESDHFIFHIEEEVLAGGARGVLEAFEQALLEEVGDALVADIVAVDDVRLTRYKAALAVEATDAAALAPLREGTFVCTVTDDAGNPIAGSRVSIDLEGGGRIVG